MRTRAPKAVIMSEIQSRRLQKAYENTKNSLNIDTQVCFAGLHTQTTMYHMDISFRSTRNKWSIAKRYSEFYRVRRTLQKFLKQYKSHAGHGDLSSPLKALDDALHASFPRRHLRYDTAAIIDERKPALEAFVQLLVKVISCIPMSESATAPATTSKDGEQMTILYQILRDFLEYPDKQIESETKLKLAVLSLEDVVVSSKSNILEDDEIMNECCSICLGEWNDEECVDMNVVKLPCAHVFHEECLMEWLHSNTHCPMCRTEPTVESGERHWRRGKEERRDHEADHVAAGMMTSELRHWMPQANLTMCGGVFERFAELGWQPFVDPAETYEFFLVSGIFKRAHIESNLDVVKQGSAQHLVQRNALFDVCLHSGLAHLIASYVRAEEKLHMLRDGTPFADAKAYLLKEPIAVQQWIRRSLENIERSMNAFLIRAELQKPQGAAGDIHSDNLRKLTGLRTVAIALVERLKEGSRHASRRSSLKLSVRTSGNDLEMTELSRLTSAGVRNLLELVHRIEAAALGCQCLLWLEEHRIASDADAYEAFYTRTRDLRAMFQDEYAQRYALGTKQDSSDEAPAAMLLIERVMHSAHLSVNDLNGEMPPTQAKSLVQLLRVASIQDEVLRYYGDEIEHEPIEAYFRVHVAVMMYFALDMAYVSQLARQEHSGEHITTKMVAVADSFAAHLNIREDMKLTLLALWLIENAVSVYTTSDEDVAVIYNCALKVLQQSGALHLHQKYDLEEDLLLAVVETLVHRGQSDVAWALWNTFGVRLSNDNGSVELALVIALELNMWQRALSIVRSRKRLDLLKTVFQCMTASDRLQEAVEGLTLQADEERIFRRFMMGGSTAALSESDLLSDESIRKVDLLVMYYALRTQFTDAWEVHHDHLALLRAAMSGDTQMSVELLQYPSIRVRKALLENLCTEPVVDPSKKPKGFSTVELGKLIARRDASEPSMATKSWEPVGGQDPAQEPTADEDVPMETTEENTKSNVESRDSTRAMPARATPQKMDTPSKSDYSPGIFSSRASQPRSSSAKKRKPTPGSASADQSGRNAPTPGSAVTPNRSTRGTVPIGSIDASPDSTVRGGVARNQSSESSARKIAQTLDFSSPASGPPKSAPVGVPPKSTWSFERRLSSTPVRSRFSFSSSTFGRSSLSTEELTLKPSEGATGLEAIGAVGAMDVDMGSSSSDSPAATPPAPNSAPSKSSKAFETPRRFQFMNEMPESRMPATASKATAPRATLEEPLEPEKIDDDFNTPLRTTTRSRRQEAASVPVRRNPRRTARTKY
ncbi:TPA: LOW QUALITY PROTEIN: hypothetical protein N0F65_011883 [Lagenidium giganteum]|uniref:Uncharacterized protein n=1 Tax=Lagenidium giganteum TaxID=4803 RepID=A0AAV2YJ56_9STRA|nr:TPA: LOW QUALITY PROTEIN: hypothetical protein N0F65_011883 [Lagenidium giganteum]